MSRCALICGVTGQDGAYLAKLLLEKGYSVVGTSRDASMAGRTSLARLGLEGAVDIISMQLGDFRSVLQGLTQARPDEIYNLSGQSSVGLSFEQPVETLESIAHGTLNLLESIRFADLDVRLYNASSGECFGSGNGMAANEDTPFRPRSPYAVAKCAAHWQVVNYREAYGLFAANGILFNHESPLRPERFVTRKITRAAAMISAGKMSRLALGNVTVVRDWGWAPEYVDAMWRMLQVDEASDFVVATGEAISLSRFCEIAFDQVGLDWHEFVDTDSGLARPSEIDANVGDPTRAREVLQWRATVKAEEVVRRMVDADVASIP